MIGAALGIAQAGLSIFGSKPVQDRSAQIGASAYNNLLSQRKTEIMNAYRKRAFERKVEQVYKQFDENFAAANASFQTEQAKFGEQMMAFAFQKEGMMRQLMEAEGYAAATESYGRSADRAKAIKTLGDYGRNNAKFIESVVSAQRQYGRNVGGISGSLAQANMNTMAPIIDGGPISEMAPRGYIPPYTQSQGGGFFNTALKVMGGIQSGLGVYKQFDTAFNPNSVFRNKTTVNNYNFPKLTPPPPVP